jgi:two-component system, OmpR family, alkaline phosphatase synthesis response regulator PhoP
VAQKILVADDEKNIGRLIQMNLERHGYEVILSEDGRDALAKIDAVCPDLIILDVMMPYVDGFEVLKRLKNDPLMAAVPVIMLTVKAQDPDIVHGLETGADFYLTKPIDPIELIAFVRRLLPPESSNEG